MTGQVHDAVAPLRAMGLGAMGRPGVRDCSRFPIGPALAGTRAEIAAPAAGARDGEFDDFLD
ncbi:hypothetical protein [Kutzneria sp. CA-103260]|uniref:hypothetical protein n=1 Tax=Kutzneria sp. CA-103260 TaxID=2802641 RepID=UPI001BAD85B5|nr:hypothetical protein [Kutzneria sp. CA-103260]QUQ66861.1 transcriptional regulator [Kutzneria sp. CA-103260]